MLQFPRPRLALLALTLLFAAASGIIAAPLADAATPRLRLSPSSGYHGDAATALLTRFPKNATVSLTWDGKALGTVTVSAAGDGRFSFTVPPATKGTHTVAARAGSQRASATYTVQPRIRLSSDGGEVGDTVTVTLRGYARGESVAIAFDATSKVLATVVASGSGSGSTRITIPPATMGRHKVIGAGAAGNQSTASWVVSPSVSITPVAAAAGANARVAVRGFARGERVEIQLRQGNASRSLAIATMSATGSANVTVTIPALVEPGPSAIRAFGYNTGVHVDTPFEVSP